MPVLPLTASKVYLVAALFKEGGYRAFKSYLSKAKDMHVLGGYAWDIQLDLAFRKAALSVLRGLGTSRQSAPFDLPLALEKADDASVIHTDGAPVGWRNLLVIGVFFIMREIELAGALAAHVTLDAEARRITLKLPVSKTDVRAVGCTRSWTCLCAGAAPRADCPFCAGTAQLVLLRQRFGSPLPPLLPLFPTEDATAAKKVDIIRTLEANLLCIGVQVQAPTGERLFGGHSFRVAGARRLAALGVEVAKIMVLARWASDAVLRYVREAPLEHLAAEVLELESQKRLVNTIEVLEAKLDAISRKVDHQAVDVGAATVEMRQELDGHVAVLQAQFGPNSGKRIISKCGSGRHKVHLAQDMDPETPPLLWRTVCGLGFAKWSFTRHTSTEAFPADLLCAKCFGRSEVTRATRSSSSSSASSGPSSVSS